MAKKKEQSVLDRAYAPVLLTQKELLMLLRRLDEYGETLKKGEVWPPDVQRVADKISKASAELDRYAIKKLKAKAAKAGGLRRMTRDDFRVLECDGSLGRKFAVQDTRDGYIHDESFMTRKAAEKWIQKIAPLGRTSVPKKAKAAKAGGR
jgi:hypothetical protein